MADTIPESKSENTTSKAETVIQSEESMPTEKDVDVTTRALNHFAQGKRHLLVNDISSAVNSLQEACSLLGKHFGETAPECGDAYFYYGKALLELARIENGVLGNALDGVPEDDDEGDSQVEDPEKLTEQEKDMVSDQVGEALESNYVENEKKALSKESKSEKDLENSKSTSKGSENSKETSNSEKSTIDKCKPENNEMKNEETMKENGNSVVEKTKTIDKSKSESEMEVDETKKENSISKADEKTDKCKSENSEMEVEETKTANENSETDEKSGKCKSAETDEKTDKSKPENSEMEVEETNKENGISEADENTTYKGKSENGEMEVEETKENGISEGDKKTTTPDKSKPEDSEMEVEETKNSETSSVPKDKEVKKSEVEADKESKLKKSEVEADKESNLKPEVGADKEPKLKKSEVEAEKEPKLKKAEVEADKEPKLKKSEVEADKEPKLKKSEDLGTDDTTKPKKEAVVGETKSLDTSKNETRKDNGEVEEKMEIETEIPESKKESTEDEDKDEDEEEEEEGENQEDDENAEKDNGETAEENGESEEPEGEQTEDPDEDEVGNLQLAWEMLELAKVIYTKQLETKPEMNLKIAQVYLKLGEVGMENENYSQSVEDLQQCLQIQKKELAADDRCLAETYYQLGLAHSFSDEFDKAGENFESATKVIESRIANLEIIKKEKLSWTDEQKKKDAETRKDPFYSEQNEIEELSNLLPEIKEKIVDMKEMKKDVKEKLQNAKDAAFASILGGSKAADAASSSKDLTSAAFSGTSESDSTRPASNITHLIRKKRKPEEDVEKADLKKAKEENGEESTSLTPVNGKSADKESPKKQPEEIKTKAAEKEDASDDSKMETTSA